MNNPLRHTDSTGHCIDDLCSDYDASEYYDAGSSTVGNNILNYDFNSNTTFVSFGGDQIGYTNPVLSTLYQINSWLSPIVPGAQSFDNFMNSLASGDVWNAFGYAGATAGEVGLLFLTGGESAAAKAAASISKVTNPIPKTFARVVRGDITPKTLGFSAERDVFVTAAEDIAGLNAEQIARRLGIQARESFNVIKFSSQGVEGIASPINRTNPGFVGGGLTSGGAREFIIPNGPLPSDALIVRMK